MGPSTAQPAAVLPLAAKLVGLAREQQDAIKRGSAGQFEWLVLRRDEVTAQLQQLAAAEPELDAQTFHEVAHLHDELLRVDEETQLYLRQNLGQLKSARGAVRRFHRAVSPYLAGGPRVPSFVDQTK